jgi:hypothetical protein
MLVENLHGLSHVLQWSQTPGFLTGLARAPLRREVIQASLQWVRQRPVVCRGLHCRFKHFCVTAEGGMGNVGPGEVAGSKNGGSASR